MSKSFNKNTVLVCLANDGILSNNKNDIIENKCKEFNLSSKRVENLPGSINITKEIHKSIEKAEFLIFDLTYNKPNIYYEIGYAIASGNGKNDLLLVAEKGTHIHFNIANLKVHYYNSLDELKNIISENLGYLIEKRK